MSAHPLRIGISTRLMHQVPAELGFRGKTLQYLEQTFAHWIMAHGAVALMVPTLSHDGEVTRRKVNLQGYVDLLDGLMLQGGLDVSPASYGQAPLRPEWAGDGVRDRYEIELIEAFLAAGKPVLGICRGCQLINVAFGGTLYQDIATQRPQSLAHVDAAHYERQLHPVDILPGTRLATLYPGLQQAAINSIHHQAVKDLGRDLVVEARAPDGLVEAIRWTGPGYVFGMQWHPEFLALRELHAEQLDGHPILHDFLAEARRVRALAPQRLP